MAKALSFLLITGSDSACIDEFSLNGFTCSNLIKIIFDFITNNEKNRNLSTNKFVNNMITKPRINH